MRHQGSFQLTCTATLAVCWRSWQTGNAWHAHCAALTPTECALQAGACFGMSAASCRVGFTMARAMTWVAAPLGIIVGVGFTSLGFLLQTLGLKDGNTVVVCTCAAVSSIGTGAHHWCAWESCLCQACDAEHIGSKGVAGCWHETCSVHRSRHAAAGPARP